MYFQSYFSGIFLMSVSYIFGFFTSFEWLEGIICKLFKRKPGFWQTLIEAMQRIPRALFVYCATNAGSSSAEHKLYCLFVVLLMLQNIIKNSIIFLCILNPKIFCLAQRKFLMCRFPFPTEGRTMKFCFVCRVFMLALLQAHHRPLPEAT